MKTLSEYVHFLQAHLTHQNLSALVCEEVVVSSVFKDHMTITATFINDYAETKEDAVITIDHIVTHNFLEQTDITGLTLEILNAIIFNLEVEMLERTNKLEVH